MNLLSFLFAVLACLGFLVSAWDYPAQPARAQRTVFVSLAMFVASFATLFMGAHPYTTWTILHF
jgi:hypothetical protein